jgi:succinate dehydrogenase / fumarate reductase, membrane anchor subunit
MVKTVLGVAHQGLRDWIIQRLSAIYLALYSVSMIAFFVVNPNVSYVTWHALFANPWMKIATILCVTSLLPHVWVGMWTIFTDYVKSSVLCLMLNVLLLLSLAVFFIWALQILWGL